MNLYQVPIFKTVILAILLTSACKSKLAISSNPALPAERQPDYYKLTVVFGTDRRALPASAMISYSSLRNYQAAKGYDIGTAVVTIPKTHVAGQIERPSFYNVFDRENPKKYIQITSIDTAKENTLKKLKELVNRSADKDAFIFVHGYNNTFEKAAMKTAQLAYDIGFKGCPIFFSWPSNGKVAQYVSDDQNAEWAVPHLKNFIQQIINEGRPLKLNIIAHSMGNKVVTSALRSLKVENSNIKFNQIVLAAPDIDEDVFREQIALQISGMSQRLTLYFSEHDKALMASSKLRSNYKRVGQSKSYLYSDIETIDASPITDYFLKLNHGYVVEELPMLKDIQALILKNASPVERGLQVTQSGTAKYWRFQVP
jgi:esterase/lipase superfamily enzyme